MAGPSTAGSSHRKSTSSRSTKKEVPKHKSSRSHKTNDSLPRNSGNETHDWSEWVYSDEYSRYYRTRVDSQGETHYDWDVENVESPKVVTGYTSQNETLYADADPVPEFTALSVSRPFATQDAGYGGYGSNSATDSVPQAEGDHYSTSVNDPYTSYGNCGSKQTCEDDYESLPSAREVAPTSGVSGSAGYPSGDANSLASSSNNPLVDNSEPRPQAENVGQLVYFQREDQNLSEGYVATADNGWRTKSGYWVHPSIVRGIGKSAADIWMSNSEKRQNAGRDANGNIVTPEGRIRLEFKVDPGVPFCSATFLVLPESSGEQVIFGPKVIKEAKPSIDADIWEALERLFRRKGEKEELSRKSAPPFAEPTRPNHPLSRGESSQAAEAAAIARAWVEVEPPPEQAYLLQEYRYMYNTITHERKWFSR